MYLSLLDVVVIGDTPFSVVGISHDAEIKYDLLAADGRHIKGQPYADEWVPIYRHSGSVDGCRLQSFGDRPQRLDN